LRTPKTTNNVPIHLPSNQSVGEGGTKEEKIWKNKYSETVSFCCSGSKDRSTKTPSIDTIRYDAVESA